MSKSVLSDRFLVVSLSIFIIAVPIFSYFIYNESPIALAFGLPLPDPEKSRAIAIALDNPRVMSEIYHITPHPGGILPNGSYHIKGVLPPTAFREFGPGIDRNRTLPAVEIIAGNESEMGQNLLVFVDLVQNRVVYIGHTKRADAYGQVPPEDYFNISIAWTGYHDGEILSDEQKAKVIRLALEDKTVQERMNGNNYSVMDDVVVTYIGVSTDKGSYVGVYPFVSFTQGTPPDQPDFQVFVTVDVDRNKVIQSYVGVGTPIRL